MVISNMNAFLIIVTVALMRLNNGAVIEQPANVKVNDGETFDLRCSFSSATTKCSWSRDQGLIDVDAFKGKYVWLENPSGGRCSIRVVNATVEQDSGQWICQVPTGPRSAAEISNPAEVIVYVYPRGPYISVEKQLINPDSENSTVPVQTEITVSENVNVTPAVVCEARYSNPAATVSWFVNDKYEPFDVPKFTKEESRPATYRTSRTLNRRFSKLDQGSSILCRMSLDGQGDDVVANFSLNVHYRTKSVQILSPSYVEVDRGSELSFDCIADGNPLPRCQWVRSSYRPSPNSTDSGGTAWQPVGEECQLYFGFVSDGDQGRYLCLAGNDDQVLPSNEVVLSLKDKDKDPMILFGGIMSGIVLGCLLMIVVGAVFLRRKARKKDAIPISDVEEAEARRLRDSRLETKSNQYYVPKWLNSLRGIRSRPTEDKVAENEYEETLPSLSAPVTPQFDAEIRNKYDRPAEKHNLSPHRVSSLYYETPQNIYEDVS